MLFFSTLRGNYFVTESVSATCFHCLRWIYCCIVYTWVYWKDPQNATRTQFLLKRKKIGPVSEYFSKSWMLSIFKIKLSICTLKLSICKIKLSMNADMFPFVLLTWLVDFSSKPLSFPPQYIPPAPPLPICLSLCVLDFAKFYYYYLTWVLRPFYQLGLAGRGNGGGGAGYNPDTENH